MNNAEDAVPPTCFVGVFSRPDAEDSLMDLFLCWFRIANHRPFQAILVRIIRQNAMNFHRTLQTYAKALAHTKTAHTNYRNQPERPGSDKHVNKSCSSKKRERVE